MLPMQMSKEGINEWGSTWSVALGVICYPIKTFIFFNRNIDYHVFCKQRHGGTSHASDQGSTLGGG